ncbi:TniQ family protein [Streptomyces sp. NPDC019507]|uniref:TniQ family protein n=1 Tax=Streptomyces sp. NPDC019507 TaxID=3154689 RepID=UPI0033E3EABE
MTYRPLARSLAPLPEESLPGFLLRLSSRLEIPPSWLAVRCGLTERSIHNARIPTLLLRELPGATAQNFALATGLDLAEVSALTLRRFEPHYSPLRIAYRTQHPTTTMLSARWAMEFSPRYCPPCLRGNGSAIQQAWGGPWKLQWHLPVTFVCPQHHLLLESVCPGCRRQLNTSISGRFNLIASPDTRLHALQCRNRTEIPASEGRGNRRCGTRLDRLGYASDPPPALSASDLERLLALQQRIDRRLFGDQQEPDATSYFEDVILAAHLITLSWPTAADLIPVRYLRTRLNEHAAPIAELIQAGPAMGLPSRRTGARAAPADTSQRAALLLAADTLLGEQDQASLREQVRPLVQTVRSRAPMYYGQIARSLNISPRFAQALATKSYGTHGHRSLRTPPRKHRYSVEEVPAYLPKVWFDTYFDGLLDHLPEDQRPRARALRRAASLQLVKLATGLSWHRCAEPLGLTPKMAAKLLASLAKRFEPVRLWPEFDHRVDQIANSLDATDERINYASRRQGLAEWRMPSEDWHLLTGRIPRLRRLHERGDPDIGTALAWGRATQGEPFYSPIVRESEYKDRDVTALAREIFLLQRDDMRGARLHLRRRLDAYAAQLAIACDRQTNLQVNIDDVLSEADLNAKTRRPHTEGQSCDKISDHVGQVRRR